MTLNETEDLPGMLDVVNFLNYRRKLEMLINESNDELYDRIESIVYILTERELKDTNTGNIQNLEGDLIALIKNAIEEVHI